MVINVILKTVIILQIKLRENRNHTAEQCIWTRDCRRTRYNTNQYLEAWILSFFFNLGNFFLLKIRQNFIVVLIWIMNIRWLPQSFCHIANKISKTINNFSKKVTSFARFFAVLYILYSLERFSCPTAIRRTEHNLNANAIALLCNRHRIN